MFDLPIHEANWPAYRVEQLETLPVAAYARKAPSSKRASDDPATTIAARWDGWEQERIGRLQDAEDAGRITRQQMQATDARKVARRIR